MVLALIFGAFNLDYLAASIGAAYGAHMVGQARVVALRTLHKLESGQVLVAAAVAAALARNPLLGRSTHLILLLTLR
jgi:hypothetical protein